MAEFTVFCTAENDGADCRTAATMKTPVPLCDEHCLQIALLVVPDLLVTALRHAGIGAKPAPLPPAERAAVIAGATPRPLGPYMGGAHDPVVYFADTGSRIKIGFSTNLRNRVRSLSLQEKDVLLLLQGGLTLEQALHDTFAKERIDNTEWFVKSDRLMGFIGLKLASLNAQHQRKVQHQQRKRMAVAASSGLSVPGRRVDRLAIVRELIDEAGGNPAGLPLRTIQQRFGVSQATASRMRSDASKDSA